MRLTTVLKLATAVVVAAAVALIAVAKSIDVNRYKGVLTAEISRATGRKLDISGPLELKLGLAPTVSASGISFANASWGSRPAMVTAERLVAQVALLPLLSGEVVVKRLDLEGPDVLLETAADGRGNWSMGSPASATAGEPGAPPTRFDIGDVRVSNARLTWRDGARGQVESLTLDRADIQPQDGGGTVAVQLAGAFRAKPFDLAGTVGAPAVVTAGKPWPLHLKGSLAGALVVADGSLADPTGLRGVDLKFTVRGDELATPLALAGIAWDGAAPPPLGPFKLSAHLADPDGRLGLDGIDAAVGRPGSAVLAVKGAVADLRAGTGADLAVMVEGDSLSGLSQLAGTSLPAAGPLKLTARLTDRGDGIWRLEDLKARLGNSDLAGELTLDSGRRPRLDGRLVFGRLALEDFSTPSSATAPRDPRLIPAGKLPLQALRGVDADLALSAARVTGGGVDLADASGRLRLDRGRLSVEPLSARVAGGSANGAVVVDASAGKAAAVTAKLDAAGVDLGRLLAAASGKEALSGGPTKLHLLLRGKGDSARTVAASLDGEVVASVGPGRLGGKEVDWAGGDLLMQVLGSLNPLDKSGTSSELRCAAAHFVLRNGVATADHGIAAETDKAVLVGGGTIDLRDESLDLAITPRARGGIGVNLGGTVAGLTRIRGTLAAPTIGVDEAGAARTAASVGAALATGGLSLLGQLAYDKVTADDHPCRTALAAKPAHATGKRQESIGSVLDSLFGR